MIASRNVEFGARKYAGDPSLAVNAREMDDLEDDKAEDL